MENKIQCIFWDWNGTLLNDVEENLAVVRRMLAEKKSDRTCTKEYYKENFGFPIYHFYHALGLAEDEESYKNAADTYLRLYDELFWMSKLFEGTESTLNTLSAHGFRQMILSASELKSLTKQVKLFSIDRYFEQITGMTDALGTGKIELGKALMQHKEVLPENTVMIGDTDHDHEVAAALGCRCILISNGHQSRSILQKTGAVLANDITEIPQLILNGTVN